MFWNTTQTESVEQSPEESTTSPYSICIHWSDGETLTFELSGDGYDDAEHVRDLYPELYDWYMSGTTPVFAYVHDDGETLLTRAFIKSIEFFDRREEA